MTDLASYASHLWRWTWGTLRRGHGTLADWLSTHTEDLVAGGIVLLILIGIASWGWHRAGEQLRVQHPDTTARIEQVAAQWLQALGTPAQGAITCEALASLTQWYWRCMAGVMGRPLRFLCDETHCWLESPSSDDLLIVPWPIPVGK